MEAENPPTTQPGNQTVPADETVSQGEWLDAPGTVRFHNFLVDSGEEVPVDLYWVAEELVDGYITVQHSEKFATLGYGEQTDLLQTRRFGLPDDEVEEAGYIAVPEGTPVEARVESASVLGDAEPLLQADLYHSHSDGPTEYLNGGGTVVVFLSPATHGTTEALPRVQSFYADLYPSGEVNFPPPAEDLPEAGPGEVVLPVGFLFGTEVRADSGPLADLMGWRWSADGECLPQEGSNSYGGDGEYWMWVVPDNAEITIHPDFEFTECTEPAWHEPISLEGFERPFALIVPTATGEPRLEIIEIPE